MPRGIPGSGTPKAKSKAAAVPKDAGASAPAAPRADKPGTEPESHPSDVDRMYGRYLQDYALKVGVVPRDVANLSEDKLRQSVKLLLAARYEDD